MKEARSGVRVEEKGKKSGKCVWGFRNREGWPEGAMVTEV